MRKAHQNQHLRSRPTVALAVCHTGCPSLESELELQEQPEAEVMQSLLKQLIIGDFFLVQNYGVFPIFPPALPSETLH